MTSLSRHNAVIAKGTADPRLSYRRLSALETVSLASVGTWHLIHLILLWLGILGKP